MTDEKNTPKNVDPVQASIAALDARLTELESVVHAIAPHSPNAGHGAVITWLKKMGERIKA